MADPAAERRRLEATYAGYGDDEHQRRWAEDQPGNRAILAERAQVLDELLAASGSTPGAGPLLDVGCGDGDVAVAGSLRLGATGAVGIDLLGDRVARAVSRHGPRFAVADGTALPFPDGSIQIVQCFTVLSSVLDHDVRSGIAAEITRVLRPGGVLLWYDMRYPSPGNRAVRPLGRRAVRSLFPALEGPVRAVTFLPPLARRLGDRPVARVLARPTFMRSHLAAVLRKAGPGVRRPASRGGGGAG